MDKKETVTVNDRKRLSLQGVLHIESFDEEYIMLAVENGRVAIEGDDLKVISLSKEGGEIIIVGEIRGIFFYSVGEGKRGKSRGIFK
jgi:sporulation protein YabP